MFQRVVFFCQTNPTLDHDLVEEWICIGICRRVERCLFGQGEQAVEHPEDECYRQIREHDLERAKRRGSITIDRFHLELFRNALYV